MSATAVGRDHELDRIDRFLSSGRPRQLVVTGDPGIGKSTLLAALADRAVGRDQLVLSTVSTPRGAQVPLAGLLELFQSVIDEPLLSGLAAPRAGSVRAVLGLAEPTVPPELGLSAAGIADVLAELARTRPVLITVDDLQWLDLDSKTVLEFALRRLPGAPVAAAVAARTEDLGGSPHPGLVGLEADVIDLRPLQTSAVMRIVRAATEDRFPRPLVTEIAQAACGNPRLALELVAAADPASGTRLAVPPRHEDLVVRRLAGLAEHVRDVVDLIAVSDRPPVQVLEDLVGPRTLGEALHSGVVRLRDNRLACDHPLTAAVVVSQLSPAQTRRLHARLATARRDEESRVIHLGLACAGTDELLAAQHERLAVLTAGRGAPAAAAGLARRAATLTPDAHDRARRLILTGRYSTRAGALDEAAASFEAARCEVASLEVERLLALTDLRMAVDDRFGAVECAEQALALAVGDPILEARCHAAISSSSPYGYSVEIEHAQAALAAIAGMEERAPDVACQAFVPAINGRLAQGYGTDWAQVERALALEEHAEDLRTQDRPSAALSAVFNSTERYDEARRRLLEVWAFADQRGDLASARYIIAHVTAVEIMAGDLAAARARLAEIDALDALLDDRLWASAAYAAWLDALTGRYASVDALAARVPAEPGSWQQVHRGRALGAALVAERRHAEAAVELALAWEAAKRAEVDEPAYFRIAADLIEAEAGAGDLEAARHHLGWLEAALDRCALPWSVLACERSRAWMARASGRPGEATVWAQRALEASRSVVSPYERGRTLFLAGVVARDAKKRRDARDLLTQARDLFEATEASRWAQRASDELAMVSGRRPGGEALSPAEHRVAELAAVGRFNREIAEELLITERTVESHLSAVYRKLGIRSRRDLGTAGGRAEPSPASRPPAR